MTTYNYTITIDDSECIALNAALNFYKAHLDQECLKGNRVAPIAAHVESLKSIREKIRKGASMTSTSSFCYSDKPINNQKS